MKDNLTGNRIEVLTDGSAGPYVITSEGQATRVRQLLVSNEIMFAESFKCIKGGASADTIFNFGTNAGTSKIQSLLDSLD